MAAILLTDQRQGGLVTRTFGRQIGVSFLVLFGLLVCGESRADDKVNADLKAALHFLAPFDDSTDATISATDKRLFTAESLARKEVRPGNLRADLSLVADGKYGRCLRFAAKSKEVSMFAGDAMHFRQQNWSGTVSFWMRLDPNRDLQAGYCDPIQITQFAWNNGAFFVDFDKDLPRDFRLGVFSDLKFWNPTNIDWEKLPLEKRPMVTVKKPPFSRAAWTHVLFTFDNVNGADQEVATASLYLNGELQGSLRNPMQFHWDLKQAAIMLGIDYIGDMDELAIFRRALTANEVRSLYQLPHGLTVIP